MNKINVKKKQISLETIEYIQRTINEILECAIPQHAKRKLCITMEKLLKDMKQKDNDYQYHYWMKYGKLDWDAEKSKYFDKIAVGSSIKIPQEYITGPDWNGDEDFSNEVQGEWSRVYY